MSIQFTRDKLVDALREWRDAGMSAHVMVDYLEGFISSKVDEMLQAKADNARAGVGKNELQAK